MNPPAMQETLVWFQVGKIPWRRDILPTPVFLDFPCGSADKESARNAGNLGSIPGLGRSPGEGKGYPLQYSDLENSMDCIVHGVAKSRTRLSHFHSFPFHLTLIFIFILFLPIFSVFKKYLLFIWPCRVLVEAHGIFFKISYDIWILCCGMWDLVPWPGMEPGPPALGVWSLSLWTPRKSRQWFLFLNL